MRAIPAEQFRRWSLGLQRSDHDAYAALFEATYDALFRYAWTFTRSQEASYDVLQDVYLKLWQVRARVDPSRSLRALLYQMVRNYALNQQRSDRRHRLDPLDASFYEPPSETFESALYARDLDVQIRAWVDEMPERRREAFRLSRYEGLSHEEIARVMGLTPKTVNNHVVLALQHLRARLRTYESTPLPS